MKCLDKEDLQQKCTAAWNRYEAKVEELKATGAALDARIYGLVKGQPLSPPALAELPRLRWEHLLASAALSQHLSKHRC